MFYLTLPSNSSMEYYPDNTASHYFTKLPQDINLTGDYEVGLSEIQFSNNYLNVKEEDVWFDYEATVGNTADTKIQKMWVVMPGGLYESNEFFIYHLNQLISTLVEKHPPTPSLNDDSASSPNVDSAPTKKHLKKNTKKEKKKVRFYYNKAAKKASVILYEDGSFLTLSPSLQRILGFTSARFEGRGHYASDFIMDLNEDFKSVYIYCDLVSARPVGDTMAPLLRIVPMLNRKKEVVHHIYEKPHYIPMSRFQFNSAEILLTTDKGKTIAFSSGSTIVTLHFRRQRPDQF